MSIIMRHHAVARAAATACGLSTAAARAPSTVGQLQLPRARVSALGSAPRALLSASVSCPQPNLTDMGIRLVVCDMAGTTVEEHGLVYQVLRQAMLQHGLTLTEAEMHPWHGAAKTAVTQHFLDREPEVAAKGVTPGTIDSTFENLVAAAYSKEGATALITPEFPKWASECRASGIKIGLNTGYPVNIQQRLLTDLGLDTMVDTWISAAQVADGRPYPYMVHRLMEQAGVADVSSVAKFGDTVNDVKEGRNAGCGLVVGVLSGADTASQLYEAGADLVIQDVTHIKAGAARQRLREVAV